MVWASRLQDYIDPKGSEGAKLGGLVRGVLAVPFARTANAITGALSYKPPVIPGRTVSMTPVSQRPVSGFRRAATVAAPAQSSTADLQWEGAVPPAPQNVSDTQWEGAAPLGNIRPQMTSADLSRLSDGSIPRPVRPSATPVVSGARRVGASKPAGYTMVDPSTLTPFPPPDQPESGPTPMVYENTDAADTLPVAIAARQDIAGANGGFGYTSNEDGTVSQMFTLRQRTPGEDAAYAMADALNPATTQAAPQRLNPGDLGYTGSQQEWEDNQALNNLINRPMGFRVAKTALDQAQLNELRRNNIETNAISQENADTNRLYQGTLAQAVGAKLPWEIAGIRSSLADAVANRGLVGAKTEGAKLENLWNPKIWASEIGYRGAMADYAKAHGEAVKQTAVGKGAVKPKDTAAALLQAAYQKGADDFTKLIQTNPAVAMQYKTLPELTRAQHEYATGKAMMLARSLDANGVPQEVPGAE